MAGLYEKIVAGHYNVTIDGANVLGCTVDGFRISPSVALDPVQADCWGDTAIDGVYRGMNVTITAQLEGWTEAGVSLLREMQKGSGVTGPGNIGEIGRLVVKEGVAKPLVMTPALAHADKKTFTFPYVFPNGDRSFNINNRLRVATMNLMCFPDSSGNLWTE